MLKKKMSFEDLLQKNKREIVENERLLDKIEREIENRQINDVVEEESFEYSKK
ncbi:FbpB family small basic protein [Rossellomorea sp. NPDC071047]|uniref:FbpB family small basic protein n=1 Tax=Rossellomorea TaxID=2837508 RepID=UPI0024950312|nr:FbpB family small basic protein [Rossellomorea aquimaris]